jgi:hypothetical protein
MLNNSNPQCTIEDEQKYSQVATRTDNAEIPICYGNERVLLPAIPCIGKDKLSILALI